MPSELVCPVCNADLPLAGDEKTGDEVYCTTCGAPCIMRGNADDEAAGLDTDF